ncbi:MAG: SurA N-terminal domain-containing protein [Gammaproteobacteria bacterium]|nr:SurA N-terminal domain-containing protein [Gammaproteobacteria bacterium]MDH3749446.1 SurA N-terminal domain-containing protein [Gammaproteobacteria bacterium]
MLTKIREKFTGGVAIAILALIGIPFLFFGVNTSFVSQQFAATVDGSKIGLAQFEQAYRDQLDRNPTWAQLPDEYRLQIRQSILESLIRERLVEMHVVKVGYQISDEQLTATIQGVPDFQVDGVFDMETYKSLLLQNGLDPKQFEASQRRALREDQLRRAIGGTAVVTPAEYRRYLNLIAEQRLVSMATFSLGSAGDEIEVSDEMVTAFYDDNVTMFLTEESADIEFIELRRESVADSIAISENILLDYYEDNKDRYLQDEQRQARHILILFDDDEATAEATASELLARVQAGESFEELAQQNSGDGGTASRGGDLGVLTRSQLPGELGSAIFAMNEGDVEGPIKSEFGFHIVRLDSVLEQGPLPLDQVRGELLSELREREAEEAFRELERQVSDVLFDAADMQTISAATGLDIQTIAGFTRSGAAPLGSNQAAIDAVFDERVLLDGEISEVIELDAHRSAVFKVTAHYEASRQPLDDVRDQITDAIRTQEAERIVFARTEQLLAALDAGEEFGPAAEAAGATVSAPTLLSRQDAEADQAVLAQVFMAKKPSQNSPVTGQVANAEGGFTVFSLDAVLPGRPESIPLADRDRGKLELAQQAGASDYFAFVQALYDKADIVISQDALAAQDLLQ